MPASLSTMTKRPPRVIDGVSYTFESKLGEGGTAEVWKVRSSVDDQVLALKQIGKGTGLGSRDERFRREIDFGMSSNNDHIVKIHAMDEDEHFFYYTMDLYPSSLREIMAEDFDYEVILEYLSQLCDGVAYVHREGVVHRDIKPENILVDGQNQRLVLADFGIAHFKDSTLTRRNEVLANRNYQAPEQMTKKRARGIGKPADIFALGLIFTEVFTKQSPRGRRHLRVRDIYPFLSSLDLLIERMTLQDETQRIGIEAVGDSLALIRRQVRDRVDEIVDDLRRAGGPTGERSLETELILERAGKDVLSAKYIFERTADEELSRYNPNYHCEISYRASEELFNTCVQSRLYKICEAKFEYEGNGAWDESDMKLVASPRKDALVREFESIQARYPMPHDSWWSWVPRRAAHYFRCCKDYHCDEVLESFGQLVSDSGAGSLKHDLINTPILWLASSVRRYLGSDGFGIPPLELQLVELERQVSVQWDETCMDDADRRTHGTNLFGATRAEESIAHVLEAFKNRWGVSLAERVDGSYSVHFRSLAEYLRFREVALATAAPHDTPLEADVLDLLRPEAEYDDLVALNWEPTYDIGSTLAKVLGLRVISEAPTRP